MKVAIETSKSPILRGEKATTVLHDFIAELEKQEGNGLTDKQTRAMLKIAQGLISSIQAEMGLGSLERLKKDTKEMFSTATGIDLLRVNGHRQV